MRRTVLALTVFCSATQLAHAENSLFFCSADDKHVRFTLESGFEPGEGHKLNHFRGALLMKNEAAATDFGKIVLASANLSHHWSHGGELRLEVFYNGGEEAGGQTVNLIVAADQPSKSAVAFSGTYELLVEGGAKPLAAGGKVSCGTK
ncbi:hypothetical protein [Rhizobium sp. Root1220]|uniref:hypothetical protein n=1 Tax=Rhizobium sp. Root1220 TaxID=1736432 RepID=UPI000701DF72|nr:hypothetical protein [Rhizobium sp. Root1220]KQV68269.1 hypothetical protein ASC90_11620 [Rhizobium sp. Root1220]